LKPAIAFSRRSWTWLYTRSLPLKLAVGMLAAVGAPPLGGREGNGAAALIVIADSSLFEESCRYICHSLAVSLPHCCCRYLHFAEGVGLGVRDLDDGEGDSPISR
jgi:hypothetical protein